MDMTAQDFLKQLEPIRTEIGSPIPKIEIFKLSKTFVKMPVSEVVRLLKNKDYDLRVGAVAILDWKARDKKTTDSERKEIFDAYINNHDWIDDWALVDRAAPYVVGGYLFNKDRTILYKLAKSQKPMERRTAIVSTYFFIRQNQLDDTFKIAEILVHDSERYVQLAVGSWVREAGKRDEQRLIKFLDKYYQSMPRVLLRYAIEHLDKALKDKYLTDK